MYKRILVAIDGSESGDLALKEALSLAAVHRATLRLVYVIDMVPPYFSCKRPMRWRRRRAYLPRRCF